MANQDLSSSPIVPPVPVLGSGIPHTWALGIYSLSEKANAWSMQYHMTELSMQVDALATVISGGCDFDDLNDDIKSAIRRCLKDRAIELRALMEAKYGMELAARKATARGEGSATLCAAARAEEASHG